MFAQRTKYRPNPIGISVVKIEAIQDNILTVRGLDANNQTPVLYIKSYIANFDIRANVNVPNWMNKLMENYFKSIYKIRINSNNNAKVVLK